MKKLIIFTIISLMFSCTSENFSVKNEGVSIIIPHDASREEVVRLSTKVRPSYRQLDYQEQEMLGFIHIGMNTFTGLEWGEGKEDPSIFNPSELNAEEWVLTFKKAGIPGVILVAKHHDGFCVWPSKYTDHTIARAPWRDGEGDLVREVAEACRKHEMKLCLYLSPWDMHEPTYGTAAYNDYFIHQIEELLTNYGPVYLLWFDGAGTNSETSGIEMSFDWERIFQRARQLQPDILLSGAAPDIRWVGNEAGRGRETEWSVQGINEENNLFGGLVKGLNATAKNLGDIDDLMTKKRLVWYPSRGGLPIRKGWFYNPEEDHTTKPLQYMIDSYFSTVGQNSNLLPNLSPDTKGKIPEKDVARLIQFGNVIRKMKSVDYAKNAKTKAISGWCKPDRPDVLTDDDPYSSWYTSDGVLQAEVEIILPLKTRINVIKLQENIRDFGQRVKAFAIDAKINEQWQEIARSTTIGFRKMVRLTEAVETDCFRIRILDTRISASLGNISLYYLDVIPKEDTNAINRNSRPKNNWSIFSKNLTNEKLLRRIIDDNKETAYKGRMEQDSAELIIRLDKNETIKGLSYFPVADASYGHVEKYDLYISSDGKQWHDIVTQGRFGNIENNPVEQYILFNPVEVRFIKMVIKKTTCREIGISEINLY